MQFWKQKKRTANERGNGGGRSSNAVVGRTERKSCFSGNQIWPLLYDNSFFKKTEILLLLISHYGKQKKSIFSLLHSYLFDSLRAQLLSDFPFFSCFFLNGLPLKMWPILTEFSHCTRGPFLYSIPSSSNANGIHLDFFFSTSNSSSRLTEEKLLFVGDRSKGFSLCQKRFFSMRIAELDMLSVSSIRKFHHPSI